MSDYIVATVGEIPPGGRKIVEVAGRSIGVFNVAGEYVALRNRCPHQGGPLCSGVLSGFLEAAEPGSYRYARKGEILRCPWHGWEFDIKTGQSWFDPARTRVRRYRVSVESGSALEDVQQAPSGRRRGPYIAETYRVSTDERYVLVTLDA